MNKNNFLISVILFTHNSEDDIKTMIDCLINQTFKSFELIIIDNCSIDKTTSILDVLQIKEYFNNLRVIRMMKSLSFSTLVNQGILAAEGEYITFLTAKDIIGKSYLECLIKPLKFSRTQTYKPFTLINFSTKRDKTLYKNRIELLSVGNLNEIIQYPNLFKHIQGKLFQLSIIKNFNLQFDSELTYSEATLLFCMTYLFKIDEIIRVQYETIISTVFINKNKLLIDISDKEQNYNIENLLAAIIKLLEVIEYHTNFLLHFKLIKSLFIHFVKPLCLIEIANDYNVYNKNIITSLVKIDHLLNDQIGQTVLDIIDTDLSNYENTPYSIIELKEDENESLLNETKPFITLISILRKEKIKNAIIMNDKTEQINNDYIKRMLILAHSYKKNVCIVPVRKRQLKDKDDYIIFNYENYALFYSSKESIQSIPYSPEYINFDKVFIHIENFEKLPKISFIQTLLVTS